MFGVLPPLSRYPSQAAYNSAVVNGQAPLLLEANNILSHPTGSKYQLLAGEGTYVLEDDLHLAPPPPHLSEAQIPSLNPLATTPQPARVGTKLSLLSFSSKSAAPVSYKNTNSGHIPLGVRQPSIQERLHENRTSTDAASGGSEEGEGFSASGGCGSGPVPAFGEGNSMLAGNSKDAGKRRKPKNYIAKSNSSFISRCTINEALPKRMTERPDDGYFAFANIDRGFQWLDLSSPTKADHLTKIIFARAHCLCHEINHVTKSQSHIDIIMGFSTGEIIWYEPISQKYTRLNKKGIINATAVTEIRWIPSSENLFLAAHMDGSLIVYNKEKEDAAFLPEERDTLDANGSNEDKAQSANSAKLRIAKSVHSKNQKFNPVSFWKLSNQRINAFAFSPDNRHIAVVAEDGTLRVLDYLKEQLLGLYGSYYGGFLCVCWSPDAKYILTGGQDDLVSIWSVADSSLIARCHGHQSWVTAVAFDPWRCDERSYRFGSVGEDCRLLLWDFSVGMLHRPKAASVRQRASISSRYPNPLQPAGTHNTTMSRIRSNSSGSRHCLDEPVVEHPLQSKATTATIPPIMSKVTDPDPLCWLGFTESSVITSCKSGHIRTWNRPRSAADALPSHDIGNFI